MSKAFTLIELMVCVVIGLIIAAMAFTAAQQTKRLEDSSAHDDTVQFTGSWRGKIVMLPTGERILLVSERGNLISTVLLPPLKAEKP